MRVIRFYHDVVHADLSDVLQAVDVIDEASEDVISEDLPNIEMFKVRYAHLLGCDFLVV